MIEAPLLKLEEISRQQKVILVSVRSYGLAGFVRISIKVWQYILWLLVCVMYIGVHGHNLVSSICCGICTKGCLQYFSEWSKTFGQIRGELCCTTLLCSLVLWEILQFWLIRICTEGLHLFKLHKQSSWLSCLCIFILCGDLGIVLCRTSGNMSMLLLSHNQITKWRISDFINLGLNFKGLYWTIFTPFCR